MTISPASVVFGVAAAASLGMAAKETISGDLKSPAEELSAYSAEPDVAEEVGPDPAEAIEAARAEALPKLAGAEVAQPGPLLAGIEFGVLGEDTLDAWTRASAGLTRGGLSLSTEGTHVNRIVVRDDSDDYVSTCMTAGQAFEAAWGDGVTAISTYRVWWNQGAKRRAHLVVDHEAETCRITFEPALGGEAWSEQALAAGKLKTPVEQLSAGLTDRRIDDFVQIDETRYSWTDAGLGAGSARSQFVIDVDAGVVVGMLVVVDSDEPTAKAAMARVREHLGAPKTEEADEAYWTGKKAASFEWNGESVTLGIGSLANGVLGAD